MYIACSKRSDSGEQCEVKKAMKSRGGLGREVRFYFFALLFTLHRSPLFERLEQANMYNKILASLKIPTTPPPPPPPPITFLMVHPLTRIWVKMSSLYVILC